MIHFKGCCPNLLSFQHSRATNHDAQTKTNKKKLLVVTIAMSCSTLDSLSALSTYVEKQAIIEPILLYRASKYKQTKEQGRENCLWAHICTFLYDYCELFFSFMSRCKQNKIKFVKFVKCNLSKKHKLSLYKTQNGESNYVDHKIFFNFY